MHKFHVQVRTVERAHFIRDTARLHNCEPSIWHTPLGGSTRHVHVEGREDDLSTVQRACGIRLVHITNLSGVPHGRE